FYQTLAFGTGGLRGRTIGKIVTTAERGTASDGERPEFPCVGTNAMNFFNISRATQGLVAYLQDFVGSTESRPTGERPKIVIAHESTRNVDFGSADQPRGEIATDNLHAAARDRQRNRQTDAEAARFQFQSRPGTGSIRWPISDGEIAKSGK